MSETAELFIDSRCELGEGPIWNHFNGRLYWFDILNQTLLGAEPSGHITDRFIFEQPVSAAALVDADTIAVAEAGALLQLTLSTDQRRVLAPIEPEKPGNRTNDSRVDRAGGFWIGTMSRRGDNDPNAGAVYRYCNGTLEQIVPQITIPNSICFSPDGRQAYLTDTPTKTILTCSLDPETGRPNGPWRHFASVDRGYPDGAVVDEEGFLWSARWQGNCVVRHAPDGREVRVIDVPASRVSCPAFGGKDLKTLYLTTAREGMTLAELDVERQAGSVFAIELDVAGLPEPLLTL